ncbi:hypothetical protein N7481_007095 [Penicillium waksmanii]|uniref:uncharacterized protein n=1 Tax=Penicillium waksmanii TaxID=69791 RepID=UPI002548E9C2|nr:uncharacterized protein N7481_007095 [Penicillium waksmanii]KAJ5979797.1 hypothetical protein N7481_007095 [Penicillium waksmanii]
MPAAEAKLGDLLLASASSWEEVEGNIYFPRSSIKDNAVFVKTDSTTFCPWKGTANYYRINTGDSSVEDAAWYYAEPYEKAKNIKDHIAFYKSKVEVTVQ